MESYSLGEEIAHSISHGIGILFGIVALVIMCVTAAFKGCDIYQIVSVVIYGFSLILLYTSSTLYHALTNVIAKKIFRIFDHASIYILIAGTYTPFTLVTLREYGNIGWIVFTLIWIFAILGVISSSIFINKFKAVNAVIYIIMGWLIVFCFPQLVETLQNTNSINALYLLIAGGVTYTLGVIFYILKFKYSHFIWHLFVLGGSIFHFIAVLLYVL